MIGRDEEEVLNICVEIREYLQDLTQKENNSGLTMYERRSKNLFKNVLRVIED